MGMSLSSSRLNAEHWIAIYPHRTHTLSSVSLGIIGIHHTHTFSMSIPLSFLSGFLSSSLCFTLGAFAIHSQAVLRSVHQVILLLLRHYISLHSDSRNRFWSVQQRFSATVYKPPSQPRFTGTLTTQMCNSRSENNSKPETWKQQQQIQTCQC